jgi:Mrp family chromosome partitioning ATPase
MGVSDAAILASEVDFAVLVVQYRKYPQQMTLRAKQMVEKVGGRLLGVVLNNINISQDSYYYYYSGYYYDYYSKSEESRAPGEKSTTTAAGKGGSEIKKKY